MNELGMPSPNLDFYSELVNGIEDRLSRNKNSSAITQAAKTLPFWQWALKAKLWIDREPFSYDSFAHLEPIYKAIPYDEDELRNFQMTIMKAAQMGGTVVFILFDIYLALRFTCNIGYYFPDQTTALDFSKIRFLSMVRSNPDLFSLMHDYRGYQDEGSMSVRKLGSSALLFLWTGMNITSTSQRVTMRTESMPLDALTFDEVQAITRSQLEKTQERVSASHLKIITKVSTPRWPSGDIHEWFLSTDQRFWHSDCRCPDGIVLSEEWPNSIGESDGRIFYRCPHCDTEIIDPQKGRYIAHNPQSPTIGFHFAQTLSRRITPAELWQAFLESHDKQNFYNRKLGRPYTNPSEVPITLELLRQKAFSPDISWSVSAGENYMGIDHMGALNVVVIKRRLAEGKERLVHIEWIEDLDPFGRCGELMNEFSIRFCSLENEPNYNEAFRFAKAFPGRVFIVEYSQGNLAGEMLRWMDRDTTDPQAVRKTTDEARMQWAVRVDQYKFMSFSLGKIKDGQLEIPDPDAKPFIRRRLVAGRNVPDNIAKLFAIHLTKIALKSEQDEKENRFTNKVEKIGSEDPHFAYANMCCDVAIARAYGTTRLITEEIQEEESLPKEARRKANITYLDQIKQRFPTFGQVVKETCGGCMNFKSDLTDPTKGKCHGDMWHNHTVKQNAPKCGEFSSVDGENSSPRKGIIIC